MNQSRMNIESKWDRPAIVARDGSATLMVRIVAPELSTAARLERPPVDLAFVIDRSGSMAGRPIELAKQAVSQAAGMLDSRDRAALVVFDDRIELLHRLTEMGNHRRNELRMALTQVDSRGSTDLCAGWLTGCRELARQQRAGAERVRRSILLTDGLANQGETSVAVIADHAAALRRTGITTTALGLGHNFDEHLLAAMAEAGGGNFAYIEHSSQLARTFERELDRLTAITAMRLNLRLRFPEGLHGSLLNPFPVERSGKQFDVALDDLSSADEVVLVFDVTGRDLSLNDALSFELSLRWTDPANDERRTTDSTVRSLRVVDERDYSAISRSDEVVSQAAMLRAAVDQRKAMELDRSGRYAESRALLRRAYDMLLDAPDSEAVQHLRQEAEEYAAYDAAAPMMEHTRKQAVQDSVARSRRQNVQDRQP